MGIELDTDMFARMLEENNDIGSILKFCAEVMRLILILFDHVVIFLLNVDYRYYTLKWPMRRAMTSMKN